MQLLYLVEDRKYGDAVALVKTLDESSRSKIFKFRRHFYNSVSVVPGKEAGP